jgi:hypothetical protein
MTTAWDYSVQNRNLALSNGGLTVIGSIPVFGIAIDLDNKKIWGRVALGPWSGSFGNPATNTGGSDITAIGSGSVFPCFSANSGDATTANFGAASFKRDIPSGFSAWSSSAVWDSANKDASVTLSNGSLTATGTVSSGWKSVRATIGHSTGKWYFEVTPDIVSGGNGWMLGIENASGTLSSYLGSTANGAGFQCTRALFTNGSFTNNVLTDNVTPYTNSWRTILSDDALGAGKLYVEMTCDAIGSNGWIGGISNISQDLLTFVGSSGNHSCGFQDNTFLQNGSFTNGVLSTAITAGHVLCLAIDLTNNRLWGRIDGGVWSGASGNPATNTAGRDISAINDGAVHLAFSTLDAPATYDKVTLKALPTFSFTVPSGFTEWYQPPVAQAIQSAVSMM